MSNGEVSYNKGNDNGTYIYATKGTYSCNNGYYRSSGWEVRTCQQSGDWNGQPAVCSQGTFLSLLQRIPPKHNIFRN